MLMVHWIAFTMAVSPKGPSAIDVRTDRGIAYCRPGA